MTEGHNIVKVSELGDLFIIGGWHSSSITKAAAAAGEVSSRISCEAASFNLIMAVFLE